MPRIDDVLRSPEAARPGRAVRKRARGPRAVEPIDAVPYAGGTTDDRLTLNLDDARRARLVLDPSDAVSVEQYRRVAAVLHEEQAEDALATVMVTSALPGEGKTLTAINLALTLAESYARRVLIVDADLRGPSVHAMLGITNDIGLTDALGSSDRELPIRQVTSGLSVMTAGNAGLTPLAGLSSHRMQEILSELAARFDWVLLDASPVGVMPDAQILARLVGGVILVIGAGSTPAAAVERAIADLGGPDAVLGTVLNRIETHRIPDAGYYARYGGRR